LDFSKAGAEGFKKNAVNGEPSHPFYWAFGVEYRKLGGAGMVEGECTLKH